MFWLYSFILTIGFLILLPRFLFDAVRKGKYAAGFWQRLGALPHLPDDKKPIIWLHCVSVGETQAARPLAREILENFPEYKLVISTTTNTGQKLAREVFAGKAALVFYFPFDWRFSVRRALRKIKPKVVLLMETELWFNFIREAKKSGAWVAIVNGRLSEKSANRYQWIQGLVKSVLDYLDLALVQTSADAGRLQKLGIDSHKVKITGNLKFDQDFDEGANKLTEQLRLRFARSPDAPLIVAASTHAPEEQLILEAFKTIYKLSQENPPRLLIAPRHPERFAEVAGLIEKTGFSWSRRSNQPNEADKIASVILLDTIGELRSVYTLAEIVFVGGSLIPHGGQNVLEPAAAGKAIVTGFYTMNFAAVVKEFLAKEAIVQLPQLEKRDVSRKLAQVFTELLQDKTRREKLAENAFRVMQANRGATHKTIEYLKPIFDAQNRNLPHRTQR